MPIVSTVHIVETLERVQLLTRPQLDEVRQALGRTHASPQALLQEVVRRAWLTSFQAQQIADGRGADLQLGPYLLLDTLGAGGSGEVFKARHRKMNRLAALKVLRPELLQDTEIVQRFYREIEVASQLAHPNIVHAYEAGPIGSRLVLVMEYIDGPDLERLVRQSGPLPVDRACEYVRQVAVGLQHASERGLVHRDIKPSNLLVAPAPGLHPADVGVGVGVVKLLDLGLARLQQPARDSRTANLTILGGSAVMQGTPDYMAPEQALDFHGADTRADIYSLGCTLFFLLAGRPPFAGGSLTEKLMKHQQAEPPLELVASRLPSGLAAVLGRMLAKRVLDRYQTPGAVAAALQPFCPEAETATLAACPTATALPAADPVPRWRRLALPLGIAALLVPLIGLGVLFLCRLTDRQPTVRSSAPALSQPSIAELPKPSEVDPGVLPVGANGKPLNLDFETGTLQDWTALGDAFKGQPVKADAVAKQRGGIQFGNQGKYWLGGYELHGDAPTGILTSAAFKVTHPWASFLLGGGSHSSTHVDLILTEDSKNIFFRVSGQDADKMRRVVVDLRPHAGKEMFIRLIDFQSGPWGHISFDDFRFHLSQPKLPRP